MAELPILEGTLKYAREQNISFCMPGHKGGRGFIDVPEGKELYDDILKCDITEVDGVDNLHNAEGMIKESAELLSRYYGSKKSYFLVNGSTSGILTMIYAAFNEGDKVIVERNCHRSVFNGIILRKLTPIYIRNKIYSKYNAPLAIDEEHLLSIIEENKDAKGIIVTYPNYYGICMNLQKIIRAAQNHNMMVLVDSAHGAHFGASEKLPQSAVKLGADIIVTSAHKTLPSLTQTAFLHIGKNVDKQKVDFYYSALQSTSPSYPFMCSMDYARFYLEKYGRNAYDRLVGILNLYREKIDSIPHMRVIGPEDRNTNGIFDIDLTRFVINLDRGFSGHKLLKYLRKCHMQAEMSDVSNVVLIITPFNTEDEIEKLYEALLKCPMDSIREETVDVIPYDIPKCMLIPYEALESDKEMISIEDSEGRICGNNIVPYPPGIPLIVMGEVIGSHEIDMIKYYMKSNAEILGVEEGKISVLK